MLSVTYYAQNYAGIISWSLGVVYQETDHMPQECVASSTEVMTCHACKQMWLCLDKIKGNGIS